LQIYYASDWLKDEEDDDDDHMAFVDLQICLVSFCCLSKSN